MTKSIAYISVPDFADCDLPLIGQLQQQVPLVYLLKVRPYSKQRTLLNIARLKPKGGVYPAAEFEGLEEVARQVDLNSVYVVNLPGKKEYSWQNLRAVWLLAKFLKRRQAGIVHLTSPLSLGEMLLYWFRRRTIITMHDPFDHSSNVSLRSRLHRFFAFRLLSRFIVLNEAQRDDFISAYHLEKKKVYNSRLSIYTHLLATVPVLPPSQGYVLFVGSIAPHKGVDILCEAMLHVHRLQPGARLLVAGSGTLYFDTAPYEQAGFLELHHRYLSNSELAGFIARAAIVVCPYRDATQSGVVMSAFALAKPVVATSVGGLQEMVAHDRHGLIVPPGDVDALAVAIASLLQQPGRLEQMSRNIRADYQQGDRSWQHIAQGMKRIYEDSFPS